MTTRPQRSESGWQPAAGASLLTVAVSLVAAFGGGWFWQASTIALALISVILVLSASHSLVAENGRSRQTARLARRRMPPPLALGVAKPGRLHMTVHYGQDVEHHSSR